MKKQFLFLTLVLLIGYSSLLLVGCSKEKDETTTLSVYIKCNYKLSYYPYESDTSLITGADVYLFKDLNFALDYVNGITYDFLGNGILKNKATGVEISFWKKELSTSSYMSFENLPNGTYAVVVDISNLVKGHKVDDWNGISIRLPMNLADYKYNNTLNFVFNIRPYQPWDIGL